METVTREPAAKVLLPSGFTSLLIAMPAYGNAVHVAACWSLTETVARLALARVSHRVTYILGESMVSRARDQIATVFLKTDCSHLLMIDSDVEFQPEAVFRLLAGARHHDLLMCAYPQKREPICFPVSWTDEQRAAGPTVHPESGCIEIDSGPAGFFMVSRAAMERLVAAHPELEYICDHETGARRFALFKPFQEGLDLYGEDISFCKRWRALGGSIWLEPRCDLAHWNGGVPFKGHPMDMFTPAAEQAEAV